MNVFYLSFGLMDKKTLAAIRAKERYYKNIERAKLSRKKRKEENKAMLYESDREYRKKNHQKISAYKSKWYQNNKNKINTGKLKCNNNNYDKDLERKRLWTLNNKDKVCMQKREWYLKNKDKVLEKNRIRYEGNKKAIKHYIVNWQKGHSQAVRHYKSINKYKRKGAIGNISSDEWDIIKEKHNHCCAFCGNKKTLTKDHIIPIVKGGTNNQYNIQPLCLSCNSIKGTKVFLGYISNNLYSSFINNNVI